jgi:hypothetical protein
MPPHVQQSVYQGMAFSRAALKVKVSKGFQPLKARQRLKPHHPRATSGTAESHALIHGADKYSFSGLR